MEVLNDLVGYKNLKIYQNPEWFSFSLDSVLLPNFVTIKANVKNIIDLGTGNCPIPLILSTKTNAKITGVEIQKDVYQLAVKTIKYNNLEGQINLLNCDISELKNIYNGDSFDMVLSNPPYFKYLESSNINEDSHKVIARHEKHMNLNKLLEISKYLLKNNGIIAIVHRTDRFIDIVDIFKKYNFEIKKVRFIYPKSDSESNLVLVEAIKNGKSGFKLMKPLIVHDDDGNYSLEVLQMFE